MRQALDRALRICLVVGLPVAILMAMAGDLALEVLFVRGAFGADDALAAAAILAAYGLGLVPALSVRSLVAGFNGRGDTRTPLKALVAATAVNIALKVVLAPQLGAVGLALATSAGISIYAFLLYRIGRRREYLAGPGRVYAGVLLAASAVAGAGAVLMRPALEAATEGFAPQLGTLAALAIVTVWVAAALGAGALVAARLDPRREPRG
jgi:putative peptidoglycan lipid II flippase